MPRSFSSSIHTQNCTVEVVLDKNDDDDDDDPIVFDSSTTSTTNDSVYDDENEAGERLWILNSMLDTNLCSATLITNQFQSRKCPECGKECSQFYGYREEEEEISLYYLNDKSESTSNSMIPIKSKKKKKIKRYYHDWCYQIKQYREDHKLKTGNYLMKDLFEYFWLIKRHYRGDFTLDGIGYRSVMNDLLNNFWRIEQNKQMRSILKAQAEIEAQEKEIAERLRRRHEEKKYLPSLEIVDDDNNKDHAVAIKEMYRSALKEHMKKNKNKKRRLKVFKRVKNILNHYASSVSGKEKVEKSVWRQYVDAQTGKKYYFNGVITTWNAPKIFDEPKKMSSSSSSSSPSVAKIGKSVWTEYEDPATGNYYYSDGVSTTWKKPKLFMTNY